jgi:hypothetical protein
VPRHAFVREPLTLRAYRHTPLPIGFDKKISQPFMVAVMLDLLEPRPDDVVLEVGTGLGYQAAVLSQLVRRGMERRDRRGARRRGEGASPQRGLRERRHPHQGRRARLGGTMRPSTRSS